MHARIVQGARSINHGRLTFFIVVLVTLSTLIASIGVITDLALVQIATIYMFTPAVAALFVMRRYDIGSAAVGIRLGRIRWLAVSVLSLFPIILVAIILSIILPDVGFAPFADPVSGLPPMGPIASVLTFVLVIIGAGITVNALFAVGEELGWRGYLLWELAPLGFWPASGVIGLAWGFWHAPLIIGGYNYPGFPIVGVFVMAAACLAFSPLYTYLVLRAQSLLAAVFFHGTFNAAAGAIAIYTLPGGIVMEQLVVSPVGLVGILVFAAISVMLVVIGTPDLSRSALSAQS